MEPRKLYLVPGTELSQLNARHVPSLLSFFLALFLPSSLSFSSFLHECLVSFSPSFKSGSFLVLVWLGAISSGTEGTTFQLCAAPGAYTGNACAQPIEISLAQVNKLWLVVDQHFSAIVGCGELGVITTHGSIGLVQDTEGHRSPLGSLSLEL